MNEPKDPARAQSIAVNLGLEIAMGLERSSWAKSFGKAVELSSRQEVQSMVAHRIANVFCLVFKDTGLGDLDEMMIGLSQCIEDGFVRWEDFAIAMKHHGHPEVLAEIEGRVMEKEESPNQTCPPRPKRL